MKKFLVPPQAPAYVASGLTGATAASRYVGATTSGAPASGTFLTGDYVIAQNGAIFVCTAGGSPGTWANVASSVSPATTVTSETTYGIAAAVGTSTLYARQDHTHGTPATPATSVAGRTGAVTLTAADIGAGTFPGANTFTGLQTFNAHGQFGSITNAYFAGLSSGDDALIAFGVIGGTNTYWGIAGTAARGTTDSAVGDAIVTAASGAALRLGIAGTASALRITSAGVTIPVGQSLVTGTRTVQTGTRTTTTNPNDTVDLGTFATTGGAIALSLHANLVTSAVSLTKVYELAVASTMGFGATVTNITNVGTLVTVTVGSTTGLVNGMVVNIAGAAGITNVNGSWVISNVTSTTFQFTATSTPAGTYTANSAWGAAWYQVLPVDASANSAATNDFALEVARTAAATFTLRFRQKSIANTGTITWEMESLGDTAVTFTPSTAVTSAPTAVSTLHPSNNFTAAAGNIGIGTDAPGAPLHVAIPSNSGSAEGQGVLLTAGSNPASAGIVLSVNSNTQRIVSVNTAGTNLTDSQSGDLLVAAIGTIRLGTEGSASTLRITSSDVQVNDNGTARSLPRGRIGRGTGSSGSGISTEVIIATVTVNLVSGRRYRVFGRITHIFGSATNGQAIMRLRQTTGASLTTAGTQVGNDMKVYGFTTQNLTALGAFDMDEFVAGSTGQFTVGIGLLQGNTNATISWANAVVTIDDIGT